MSWYEAVAFCRWLSTRLGFVVTLPTEQQWERAARGTRGFDYPWGEDYRSGCANCQETRDVSGPYDIGRTTAVGIYPQGASPEGVLDLAGNVWEWCLNEYDTPKNVQVTGRQARVVRGGSWRFNPAFARSADRGDVGPGGRGGLVGFRVVCSAPIETLDAGLLDTGSLKS